MEYSYIMFQDKFHGNFREKITENTVVLQKWKSHQEREKNQRKRYKI